MHLCEPCASSRDWVNDPVVKTKIALNLQQTDENRMARCATCRTRIRNPLFQLCAKCAEKACLCQACSGATAPSPQHVVDEAFETLFDAFVTLVKTYGADPARKLLAEAELSPEEAPHVATLVALDVGQIDAPKPTYRYHYRLQRPIWTKVWGQLSFTSRPPRCENCPPPPRAPAMASRAANCGHWTAGHGAKWCLPCAVEHRECSVCETSTE